MSQPLDAQSRAFRENPIPVLDHEIPELAERIHDGGAHPGALLSPDDWEAVSWDSGREGPKTLDEARAALAARIADPTAPDGAEALGAYNDLGRHSRGSDA